MGILIVRNNSGIRDPASTTIPVTMGGAPIDGNFMVACIITNGSTTGRVSSISETGATWVKVIEVANTTCTAEIWAALNVSGASASITVNLAASLLGIAFVGEYSGLVTSSATDKTASNTGSTGAVDSGTTATTTQADELWIACLGIHDLGNGFSLAPTNGFRSVDSNTNTTSSGEYCEKIVSSTGTANTSDTDLVASTLWSGVIATFKAAAAAVPANFVSPPIVQPYPSKDEIVGY